MGKRYPALSSVHQAFIEDQHLFFVASAAPQGRVNVSPKGMDSLRVLSPSRIVWLSVTGSGNETAAHLLEAPRMTLMWCAFDGRPMILRAYGQARAVYPRDPDWDELSLHFPALPGTRSLFDLSVDLVQTSCGMAVPLFDYAGERDDLNRWAEAKGEDGLKRYRQEKNLLSLDGKPTGLTDPCA